MKDEALITKWKAGKAVPYIGSAIHMTDTVGNVWCIASELQPNIARHIVKLHNKALLPLRKERRDR